MHSFSKNKLGIHFRIAMAFFLGFGVMASAGMLMLRSSLLPSFIQIEEANVLNDAARVISGFDGQLAKLQQFNRDWANWDDMFEFARNPTQAFIHSNLQPDALKGSELPLVIVYNVHNTRVNYTSSLMTDAGMLPVAFFAPYEPIFFSSKNRNADDGQCGLLQSPAGLLLLCWHTIYPTEPSPESGGTVVIARLVNEEMLKNISSQAKVPFELLPPTPTQSEQTHKSIEKPHFFSDQHVAIKASDTSLLVQYTLRDIRDQALYTLQMKRPRDLLQRSNELINNTAWQLGTIALATGVFLFLALQFWLGQPIERLRKELRLVRSQKNWNKVIPIERNDEIGELGFEINGLLGVIHAQVQDLESLSMKDALTGLANRRRFDARLQDEIDRAQRTQSHFSLLTLDIDFFKQYNDHYGHAAGDHAIQTVAQVLQSVTRLVDLPARVGGEEFFIILPGTEAQGAVEVANKLQDALRQAALPHVKSLIASTLTVSIGIATSDAQSLSGKELMERADHALYAAKHAGRNCIHVAPTI